MDPMRISREAPNLFLHDSTRPSSQQDDFGRNDDPRLYLDFCNASEILLISELNII